MLLILGGIIAAATIALSWFSFSRLGLLSTSRFRLRRACPIYLDPGFHELHPGIRRQQTIRSAFSQYISPALVDELARSPEKLALGGDRRDMTVMFSDVRGFTAVSEAYKDDPQGLTALAEPACSTPLTNAMIDHKGTIDKYMGDGIMAFWNAPLPDDSHELERLRGGPRHAGEPRGPERRAGPRGPANGHPLSPLQDRHRPEHRTMFCRQFRVRSALQLFGSRRHRERLVAPGKPVEEPTGFPSSWALAHGGSGQTAAMPSSNSTPPGRRQARAGRIFTLIDNRGSVSSPDFSDLSRLNELMLAAYRRGDWDGLSASFSRAANSPGSFEVDGYHAIMVDRIRALIEVAPRQAGKALRSSWRSRWPGPCRCLTDPGPKRPEPLFRMRLGVAGRCGREATPDDNRDWPPDHPWRTAVPATRPEPHRESANSPIRVSRTRSGLLTPQMVDVIRASRSENCRAAAPGGMAYLEQTDLIRRIGSIIASDAS